MHTQQMINEVMKIFSTVIPEKCLGRVVNMKYSKKPFVGQSKLQWIDTLFSSLDNKCFIFVNNTDRRWQQ